MISWLKGEIIHYWKTSAKKGIVLNVGGIGYEIQLLPKQVNQSENNIKSEIWIHQIEREDCTNLYGFLDIDQRDLFRQIISVNGIGPQIGMALLEDFEVNQLVRAITENDLALLTKSHGIGKRIAERLIVELRNKIQRFIDNNKINYDNINDNKLNQFSKYIDEIYSILISLGYDENEIKDSIKIITTKENENSVLSSALSTEEKAELMDKHLKEILIRLSQKST